MAGKFPKGAKVPKFGPSLLTTKGPSLINLTPTRGPRHILHGTWLDVHVKSMKNPCNKFDKSM